MKKMKKALAVLAAMTMLFGMVSCDGGKTGGDTTTAPASAGTTTAAASQSSTKVDLEGYSISLPSGWVSIPSSDKKSVKVYKTDDVNKIFGVNEIDITYKAKAKYTLVTSAFDSFEEVKDLKLGSYTWNGAKGPYGGGKELMSLNTTVGEGYISAGGALIVTACAGSHAECQNECGKQCDCFSHFHSCYLNLIR